MMKNWLKRRATRRSFLGGLGVAALAGAAMPRPGFSGTYKDYAYSLNSSPPGGAEFRPDLEEVLDRLANAYRVQEGKPPLTADPMFQLAARAHAADMMAHNFMGHQASTGHDFDSRMRAFVDDITRFPAMGENAARDSQDTPANAAKAKALFQQWVKSRSHRKTLRSLDYAFVSTGVVQRGNTIWAVQIFWAKPREKGIFQ